MPIPNCKLRKCQGRRGCLCPSRPAIARPYAHVSESVRAPGSVQTPAAPPAEVAAASAPEKEQQPPTAPESTPPAPTPAPAPAPDAAAAAATQASSSESPSVVDTGAHAAAEAGDNSTVKGGGGGDEAAQSPGVEEAPPPAKPAARLEPLEGEVTLRYNHYKHKFTTVAPPGRVSIPEINERFSFSYGFQGDYKIHLRGPGPDGDLLAEEGDEIVGLELGLEYFCDVEEDPEEAKKERKAYKAQTVDNTVAVGDGAQNGEDSASCSCIEGNPCAVKYNCKNWNGRFEVAKANGWKGF